MSLAQGWVISKQGKLSANQSTGNGLMRRCDWTRASELTSCPIRKQVFDKSPFLVQKEEKHKSMLFE